MRIKKIIGATLAGAAILCVPSATAAEETTDSFDYTLAYDYFDSFQNPEYKMGSTVYQAFILNRKTASGYAGSEVTSVNITTGTFQDQKVNHIKNITVFLAEDIDKEPFYTQSAKLGDEGATLNKIQLDTPYKIEEGKQVVIGYYFRLNSEGVNYLSVDGTYHQNMDGGWIGNKVGNGSVKWSNISQSNGNLCIGCTITGDNLAQDGLSLLSMDCTEYSEPGAPFEVTIYYQNTASNNVTDFEVSYSVGDASPVVQTCTLQTPLSYNQRRGFRFSGLKAPAKGVDIPITFEITKVNGKENSSDDFRRTAYLNCFEAASGFPRRHLLEEGTGTWCKWCPAGIVMMDMIKKTYPEYYSLVAVHSQDEMEVASTDSVRALMPGYPAMIVDRSQLFYPQNAGFEANIAGYTKYYAAIPSVAGVTALSGEKDAEGNLKVKAGVKFALDLESNGRYRLGYYITENGVGPYMQNNSEYMGGAHGPMGGWENEHSEVSTIYDEVARVLEGGATGIAGSIPSSIKEGEEYMHESSISLAGVTKDNVELIAFIMDAADGTIVNTASVAVDLTNSGVEEAVGGAGYMVKAVAGGIAVGGEFARATIYSIAGEKRGELTEQGEIALAPGVYVVSVDGKTVKVIL